MSRTWRESALAVPGIAVALMPKLLCPACLPAYAGLLSAVGLGVLITTYLLPVTAVFLAVTLLTLAYKAKHRHGYIPFWIGLVAVLAILLGKFRFEVSLRSCMEA